MGLKVKMSCVSNTHWKDNSWCEDFSKKWVIATERLKPFLKGEEETEKKELKQNFKRNAHSFVYTGGKTNG